MQQQFILQMLWRLYVSLFLIALNNVRSLHALDWSVDIGSHGTCGVTPSARAAHRWQRLCHRGYAKNSLPTPRKKHEVGS